MNKKALLEKEITTKKQYIKQQEEELANLVALQTSEINALISAHNSIFPNAALPLMTGVSTEEIGTTSQQSPSIPTPSEIPSTPQSVPKTPVSPKPSQQSSSTFVPQKPGASHPLHDISEKIADSTPEKYYVVYNGPMAGIYTSWAEAAKIVNFTKGAIHKSFKTKDEALTDFETYTKQPANSYAAQLAKPPSFGRSVPLGIIKTVQPPAYTARPDIFMQLIEKIQSYSTDPEKYNLEGWYPTFRYNEIPKVICMPHTDPNLVFEFFTHGLVDSIYFKKVTLFREFSQVLQKIVQEFISNVLWNDKDSVFFSREGFWGVSLKEEAQDKNPLQLSTLLY